MIRRLLVLLFLAVAAPAFASVSNVAPAAVRTGASSFAVAAASDGTLIAASSRTVTAGATSGEFLIRDMFTATGPAGSLPLTSTRTVSGLGAARAIASVAARGVAPIGMGLTAYELVQAYRMRGTGSGIEHDSGVDPVTTIDKCWVSSQEPQLGCFSTAYAAAISGFNTSVSRNGYTNASCEKSADFDFHAESPYGSGYTPTLYCKFYRYSYSTGFSNVNYTAGQAPPVSSRKCTESATGAVLSPGLDGKCPTGRYESVSTDTAASMLAAAMTVAVVQSYVNSDASKVDPVPETKPMTVTGPASQVGQAATTTTTTPTGTRTETRTPTYQYNYAGNTIIYNTTNTTVTNVTNNQGGTETTTETKPEEPQKGDCELYPKSVGCLDLGEVPDEEIPEKEEEVDLEKENVDLPAGCPADLVLPGGRVLSYASACTAAVGVAPFVEAAGMLSALLIAVAAIRSN